MLSPRAMAVAKTQIEDRLAQIAAMDSSDVQVTSKGMIYEMFNDGNSSVAAMWISNLINLVIMGSTVGFVAETADPYRAPSYEFFWFVMECLCVGLFSVDFGVRAFTCPKFGEFSGDAMNWVDFIAIVPFYIERFFDIMGWDGAVLGNLRVIRVLRLARVLKILAKSSDGPSLEEGDGDDDVGAVIGEIVSNSAAALLIPLYFMWLAIIVFASVNFYVEKTEPEMVIHHCVDYSDLSTCSMEVPHMPFSSACPPSADFNSLIDQSLAVDNDLMYMRGHTVGHPCTIQALMEYENTELGLAAPSVDRCGFNAPAVVEDCTKSDATTTCALTAATVDAAGASTGGSCAVVAATCTGTADADAAGVVSTCDLTSGSCPAGCVSNSCAYVAAADEVTGKLDFTCEVVEYYMFPGKIGLLNADDASSSDMFPSIPHAIWWCIVTMTTVGYGDKYPLSWKGQVVGICTAAMGIFFISMPLAIVGSSFANSCDKLQNIQDQKDAVKASEQYGYGSISFMAKSHAPLVMKVYEMEKTMTEISNILEEDVGVLDRDEAADVMDLIFDLRELQTLFTPELHKELFLGRVKKNRSLAEAAEAAGETPAVDDNSE